MSQETYDLVVIGGGAAGLTSAGIGASLGASTLLIEKDRLGGDCTWTGCVPSKTLLQSAHVAQTVRDGERFGVQSGTLEIDFETVTERIRETREKIYEEADSPEHLEEFGIEVQHGTARFESPHRIAIEIENGTRMVNAKKVVIATGGRPAAPPIEGLQESDYLDNHSLFELKEQPEQLGIIGAGPIGTEMAQAFQRLGTQVTVLERADRILLNDHPILAEKLQHVLEAEGVKYHFGAEASSIHQKENAISVRMEGADSQELEFDRLLVATGRAPNVENLGLDAIGVEYEAQGISVDDRCRTSHKHIYAVGDVTGKYQFTHMSEHMAKVAISNALLKLPEKIDADRVPWVTYADPELAHVGKTQQELDDEEATYETYRFPMDRLDRAICEGETVGEIRIYAKKWRGKILGADVLGTRAGELIGTIALAMKTGASLRTIADTIFPYPTYGQGVRRAADQWYAEKQLPWVVKGVQKVFGYDGPVIEPDPDRIV